MADETITAVVKAIEVLDKALEVGHEVAEIVPHKEKKGEIYQVGAANNADIALQQSMFMAQYQLLNNTFGIQPANFKDWVDAFENCFPTIQKVSRKIDGEGNGVNPWMQGVANRPRIRILNTYRKEEEIATYLYIEFYPERKNESEVYFVEGTAIQCVERIWQIWYLRQIIKNADLAQVLGEPPSDWIRKRPSIGITVVFNCYNYKEPPFWKSVERQDFKKVQITIPMADRSKLSYQNIRQALGGSGGMEWGAEKAVAWVADDPTNFAGYKGMPQIWAKGQSYSGAKTNVKRLLALSKCKIVRMNKGAVDNEEFLNPLAKEDPPMRVYPGVMWILNSNLVGANLNEGRERSLGKFATRKNRIKIYEDVEPSDFQETVTELLAFGQ